MLTHNNTFPVFPTLPAEAESSVSQLAYGCQKESSPCSMHITCDSTPQPDQNPYTIGASGEMKQAIGNTPLVRLHKLFPDIPVFGKLEMMNIGGSVKDRTAQYIVERMLGRGEVQEGGVIVESTSGNMGVGLAQICKYHNLQLIVVVDPYINVHTLKLLKAYGAHVEMVADADSEGSYLSSRLKRVHQLIKRFPGAVWTDQYHNLDNPQTHASTFQEIVEQLGRAPDYILIATSTCGTYQGFLDFANAHMLPTKVIPIDAKGSAIFGYPPGPRLIPGFGSSKPSGFISEEVLHPVIVIDEWESVVGCHRLLEEEAIMAGGSSGAVVMAAEKLSKTIDADASVVLVICDRGERYLETIYNPVWLRTHFGDEDFLELKQVSTYGMDEELLC